MTDALTDNVVKTDTVNGEQSKTVPLEQYQGLQRKFDKERQKRIEAEKRAASASVDNPSTRTEELLTETLGVLAQAVPDMSEKLTKVQGDFKTRRERERFAADKYAELTGLVETNEIDWDGDEKYTEARKQWDSGKLDEAIVTARRVTDETRGVKSVDIEALVEAKVAEKLKVLGKVDTGTSTVTNVQPDLAALTKVDTRGMTLAQLKEHGNKINAAYFKATGVKFEK